MHISLEYVREAISQLEYIHPFYGITYLVCKRANLPVGSEVHFPIENLETEFLEEYFQPFKDSEHFFRLFRLSNKLKLWVPQKKYASSTLQSIRTRGAFSSAFIHDLGTSSWGWQADYLGVLRANLAYNLRQYKNEKIPVFLLSCWLYRERDFGANTSPDDLVQRFLDEFHIRDSDMSIFDTTLNSSLLEHPLLQPKQPSQQDLFDLFGNPPDAVPEKGETLSLLELQDVGPLSHMSFQPSKRLNLITGDNGLGKTFLLECAWWALTGQWKSREGQASPRFDKIIKPAISFQIAGEQRSLPKTTVRYDVSSQQWKEPKERPTIDGLAIYARVDGSFAIWNPVRQELKRDSGDNNGTSDLKISSDEVWTGVEGKFEGLLRDWLEWQNDSESSGEEVGTFEIFKRVLARLSPPDLGTLEPGTPVRLAFESKRIPTLKHSYGEVPIIFESAAVRRILSLAYLIVWNWNEHVIYSHLAKRPLRRSMVVIVDEIEAHLHPLWQRRVLPALLDVGSELSDELQTQFLISTHSPLVMASAESIFSYETDGLFHLDLTAKGAVTFSELSFVRQGSVDAWLTSKIFDLRHARSYEAEIAIEKAKALQDQKEPDKAEIEMVNKELLGTLAADDGFWSRWNYFAELNGVNQ